MTISKIKVGEEDGRPIILKIDNLIRKELDRVKIRVKKKNWDYLALCAGIPGSGKSTLAKGFARYLCPWFNIDYIAFSGDEFIEITQNCPDYSAVILDESFASLNSKITMTEDYIKLVNHLQIIRQKHLFMFICLPNFFDLSKGIAIFRSSHLFVTYSDDEGERGQFLVFDRDRKRKLYVKGGKFMDYNSQKCNFFAQYYRNDDILDVREYERLKEAHMNSQNRDDLEKIGGKFQRNKILWKLYSEYHWKIEQIASLAELDSKTIYKSFKKFKIMPETR